MGTLWEKSAKKRIFTSSKSYFDFLDYKQGAQSKKELVKNEYILLFKLIFYIYQNLSCFDNIFR